MEAERGLLQDALALLEAVCPALEERALLADALRQLDELFLLVIVGEFNSGKSAVRLRTPSPSEVRHSLRCCRAEARHLKPAPEPCLAPRPQVINALLGDRFLEEGILPTTNEISVLKFAEDGAAAAGMEQNADGFFVSPSPAA